MSLCGSSRWIYKCLTLFSHLSILLFILTSLKNDISWLKTTPLPGFCFKHVYSTLAIVFQIQAMALMTIILGCRAATLWGWILCKPRLLTGQIR